MTSLQKANLGMRVLISPTNFNNNFASVRTPSGLVIQSPTNMNTAGKDLGGGTTNMLSNLLSDNQKVQKSAPIGFPENDGAGEHHLVQNLASMGSGGGGEQLMF